MASACTPSPEQVVTPQPTLTTSSVVTTTTIPTVSAIQDGLPWWNDRVFYEVFVRSFADSNGDGDGDLVGLTDRLDYLNDGDPATDTDLGITGIWLMPVFDSPSYHGYDVTDYRTIEPDYGTLADFQEFLEAAHDRGIAVIVDLVMNHSSRDHPWFTGASTEGSATADWYIFEDEDPGWRGPWGQNVWHERDDAFYYGLFWEGMPDLNLTNESVTAEMHDVASYWLGDVGVDGFRLDAARHFVEDGEIQEDTPETMKWLTDFRTEMHSLSADALILGEVWADTDIASSYVPDALDLTFGFGLGEAFLDAMTRWDARPVEDALAASLKEYPHGQLAPFLTNHDQNRIMSQLAGNWERAELASVWLLTLPGTPFVYYGEEVGLKGIKPDERIRTPMPWTDNSITVGFTEGIPWEPPDHGFSEANVGLQSSDPDSLLSTYRKLIHFRNSSNALRLGTTTILEPSADEVYAVLRSFDDEHVLTLLNLSGREILSGHLNLSALGTSATTATIHGDTSDTAVEDLANYWPTDVIPPFGSYVIEIIADH